MAHAEAPSMSSIPTTPTPGRTTQTTISPSLRNRRQLGLFFSGAAFLGIATLITRRSLVRRYKATVPSFYQPSNRPPPPINGQLEALDALAVATANVFSVAVMSVGGLLWAFDIATIDELRAKIRGGVGVDADAGRESRAEKELEEWLAGVLERKKNSKTGKKDE